MDELQIFNYENHSIRTIEKNGEPWWVLKDVCDVLGLDSSHKVAERLDEDEKGRSRIPTPGGVQKLTIINESGLYNVILRSDKPGAKKFKRWVTHEVLPAIRKTGGYTMPKAKPDLGKRLEVLEKNARTRAANLYLKIAANEALPKDYRGVFLSYASKELAGQEILPLPKTERKTYSSTEIGEMFGMSANKIGRLTNEHGLKTPEYGQLYHDKSQHSIKEVDTFRYYDAIIPKLEEILGLLTIGDK